MSNDDDWIRARIAKAKNRHQLVTQSVTDQMEALLNGPLGERQLSKADLAIIAKDLIAGMIPVPPEAEATP